ncbi:hypothetical protein [Streptomyces sp. NPDC059063]|uniref:hypothetical protein n=1 Tax=unclassified Streptomyces TaxID=2593676 RepID=UPI003675CA3D
MTGVGEGDERDERERLLPEELRALGRALDRPESGETMVERVLAQIVAEGAVPRRPGPGARLRDGGRRLRHGLRARWRSVTASACALLTVLALTPPVRAAVSDWFDWFDFGGVEVRYDPSPPTSAAGTPGCGASPVSLARAERAAGFRPVVPKALGEPDAAAVTRGPGDRFLITLCWREGGRTVRLDEFPAQLDPGFTKRLDVRPDWEDIGVGMALWFARPHRLEFWMRDAEGEQWTRTERTAGPTLLWTHGEDQDLTLRLEGVASKDRALGVARSVPR